MICDLCIHRISGGSCDIRYDQPLFSKQPIDDAVDPLDYKSAIDYAIIYDQASESIRFASDDMRVLAEVIVRVYTVGGRLLYTFSADTEQSVAELPSGTYIVSWTYGETSRSIKFKK